jgi:uncharacterized protein (DUF2384 family)
MKAATYRSKMVEVTTRDVQQRARRLELLKGLPDDVVLAASRAFDSPAEAADWLITAGVSINDDAPLDFSTTPGGRVLILRHLRKIEFQARGSVSQGEGGPGEG